MATRPAEQFPWQPKGSTGRVRVPTLLFGSDQVRAVLWLFLRQCPDFVGTALPGRLDHLPSVAGTPSFGAHCLLLRQEVRPPSPLHSGCVRDLAGQTLRATDGWIVHGPSPATSRTKHTTSQISPGERTPGTRRRPPLGP